MIPQFDADGLLPPGIHRATWDEVTTRFGNIPWRRQLVDGLEMAIDSLRRAGCRTVYIDGSFATRKEVPNDFDVCWDEEGVAAVTGDSALRFGHWFGMDPQFWLNLQAQYELALAEQLVGAKVRALPTPELLDPVLLQFDAGGRPRRPGIWVSCFPPHWEPQWRECRFSNSSRRIVRPAGARA